MMESTSRLTLNLQYPNIAQVAYAMQGDRLSRAVVADLIDGSTPWAPPAGAYGLITASKPDGTFAVYDTLEDGSPAIVIDGSTVTFYLAEQVLADAGAVKMSVAFFTSAGARLTTFRWTEVVAPEAVLDRVVSGNYISILTATMAEAAEIFQQIRAAYGAPLTANTAAAMTDTDRVYVYTGTTGGGFTNGHWYYWNGSAWTDGGNYNSTGFTTDTTLTIAGAAADAKATGDQVSDLKSALENSNLNQHIKTVPFVVGNGVGELRALRGNLTVLPNGSIKAERSGSSSTLTYGFYFLVMPDRTVDLTGHKIYFSISGFDGTGAAHFSNFRFNAALGSTAQGGLQTDLVDVPPVFETILIPNANIDRMTLLVVPGETVDDGEYFTIDSLQFVDLTAMFGAGNEPTLDEFREVYSDVPYPFLMPTVSVDTRMIREFVTMFENQMMETAVRRLPDVQADADLNMFTHQGYQLLFAGYDYDNWPDFVSVGSAWLIVLMSDSGYSISQILIRNTTGEICYRRCAVAGLGWYPWNFITPGKSLLYSDLQGKKISIIGDSISTYQGFNPEGYAYYYPKTGLNNVDDTWWKRVADTVGATILVNASWSGSWVCYDSSVSADSAKIAYTDARVNALADGTTTPDIVIVLIGTNDFIHNGGNPVGTLNEDSEIPDGSTPITEFKPAYAHMINKIKTNYPHAHVYCCTLIGRYRGTDTEYPIKNANGVAIANYNNAIVDVALWLGCNIIRLDTVFSLGEVPQYTVDGTLHPNAAGAALIANNVISALSIGERKFNT